MFAKLRNSYHNAHEWAHHHTIIVGLGLFLFSFMAMSQFAMPAGQTYAAWSETWCSENVTDIPQVQCEALSAIYASTSGSAWTINDNWFSSTSVCNDRYGVSCSYGDEVYNVTSLQLNSNNLQGYIPSEIGDLSYLDVLYLGGNTIDSIPSTIGQLTNLTTLSLSSNPITILPSEIGNLTNLQSLHIDNLQLENIPMEIGNLTNLLYLNLSFNNLSNIQDEIRSLTALTELRFSDNNISTLSSNIGNLSNLQYFAIDGNNLTTLPSEIGNLSNLEVLVINHNSISSLPPQMTMLTGLAYFRLDYNRLTELNISGMFALQSLSFQGNLLDTLFMGPYQNYTQMQSVNAANNCLALASPDDDNVITFLDTYHSGRSSSQDNCEENNQGGGEGEGGGEQNNGLLNIAKSFYNGGNNIHLTEGNEDQYFLIEYSNYMNTLNNVVIKDYMPTGLVVTSTNPMYDQYITTQEVYGEEGDVCFDQFFNETGVYYTALNAEFMNEMGMSMPEALEAFFEVNIAAEQEAETFYQLICLGDMNRPNLQECIGNLTLGENHTPLDISTFEGCGFTTEVDPYYMRNIETLESQATGDIQIYVDIDPSFNESAGYIFTNTVIIQNNDYSESGSVNATYADSDTQLLFDCQDPSITIPEAECNALVDLYNSTDGDNWDNNNGWLQNTDICAWYGVACGGGQSNIISLELDANNLVGTLPSSIGNLSLLEHFTIHDNSVSGEIPASLWTIGSLRGIFIGRNNLEGILSNDFSAIERMDYILAGDNPNLFVDFNSFLSINNSSLIMLDVGEAQTTGSLLNLSSFSGLTSLNIDGINHGGDIYEIWTLLPNFTNLVELGIKDLGLGGSLPDIWHNFPLLERIGLQFNELIGPLPPSFSSLTNLNQIEISFNNFDGAIPTFLMDLEMGDYGDISSNCFNTNINNQNLVDALDANFQGWRNQFNCKANIQLDSHLASTMAPGMCTTYTINYNNLGPQAAHSVKIGQIFDAQVSVSGSNTSYTTGKVGATYGTMGDSCYASAATQATGPYYSALEASLFTNYNIPSVYRLAVDEFGFAGEEGSTEFGYVMDNICPRLFGTENKQTCFLMLGIDMTDLDPSCGYGGDDGYIWSLDTIPASGSGEIQVDICLANDATGSVSFSSLVSTVSDNANDSIITQSFDIVSDNEDTSSPTLGPSRGNPVITVDQCLEEDLSGSYYDGSCEAEADEDEGDDDNESHPSAGSNGSNNATTTLSCTMSNELLAAHAFAYSVGITSVPDVCTADMYGGLTRIHMAKFVSQFATQILGMSPDTSIVCDFADMEGQSTEMQAYAIKACQLGVMGLQQDGTPDSIFNPNNLVTRAMVGASLSRLFYGPVNNVAQNSPYAWYDLHLRSLQKNGIMQNISKPHVTELRGYLLLMLQRAKEKLGK